MKGQEKITNMTLMCSTAKLYLQPYLHLITTKSSQKKANLQQRHGKTVQQYIWLPPTRLQNSCVGTQGFVSFQVKCSRF